MTRTVALADDAYAALAGLKKAGQSFSEIVRELAKSQRPTIRDVCGSLAQDGQHWEAFARQRRRARTKTQGRAGLDG